MKTFLEIISIIVSVIVLPFAASCFCKKGSNARSILRGISLLLAAFFAFIVIGCIGFVYGTVYAIVHKNLYEYYFNIALTIDKSGNVLCASFFNDTMLKKCGTTAPFGTPDETISSVLGKNKQSARLNGFGRFWAGFLNAIQENHVENSIQTINL
jgi:hypothetical protein